MLTRLIFYDLTNEMESLLFKVNIHALVESVSRKLDLLEFFKNSKHTKGKKHWV